MGRSVTTYLLILGLLGLAIFALSAAACSASTNGTYAGYVLVGFLAEHGGGPGQLREPMGIAAGPAGELYIADTRNQRIQVLSPDGDFIRQWGSKGNRPGEFEMPFDVATGSDGTVYVADYELDRVSKFTAAGEFILAWGSSGPGPGELQPSATAPTSSTPRITGSWSSKFVYSSTSTRFGANQL